MTQIQRETAPRVILSYSKRMARSYPRGHITAKFLLSFWCSCGYLPVHWMTLSYTFVPVLPWRIFRIYFLLFLLIVSLLWCPFFYKELLLTISVILICWLSIFPLRDPNNNWEIEIFSVSIRFFYDKVTIYELGALGEKMGLKQQRFCFISLVWRNEGLVLPPLGCLEHHMQLWESCVVNSGSWNYQGLSLGLYHSQTFFLKEICLSRDSVKWSFH